MLSLFVSGVTAAAAFDAFSRKQTVFGVAFVVVSGLNLAVGVHLL